MCLMINRESSSIRKVTNKFFNTNWKSMTFYKVLEFSDKRLHGPYYTDYTFHGGWNCSNIHKDNLKEFLDKKNNSFFYTINHGIHVFYDRCGADSLKCSLGPETVVVKVTGYQKDFLGANHTGEAAFTKVWISAEEIRSAKRKVNPRRSFFDS